MKIHKEKTKYMVSCDTNRNINKENETTQKVAKYTYLGQRTTVKNRINGEIETTIRNAWYHFGKSRKESV